MKDEQIETATKKLEWETPQLYIITGSGQLETGDLTNYTEAQGFKVKPHTSNKATLTIDVSDAPTVMLCNMYNGHSNANAHLHYGIDGGCS